LPSPNISSAGCGPVRKYRSVVLKGATWLTTKEFLTPGRKFVRGRNWGGKAVDEKPSVFIIRLFNTYKNCTARLV